MTTFVPPGFVKMVQEDKTPPPTVVQQPIVIPTPSLMTNNDPSVFQNDPKANLEKMVSSIGLGGYSAPAINKMAGNGTPDPNAKPKQKPPKLEGEALDADKKLRKQYYDEAMKLAMDAKKEFPHLDNNMFPEFQYKTEAEALNVKSNTVKKHLDNYEIAINKLKPKAQAEGKVEAEILAAKGDAKVKAAVSDINQPSIADTIGRANQSINQGTAFGMGPQIAAPIQQGEAIVSLNDLAAKRAYDLEHAGLGLLIEYYDSGFIDPQFPSVIPTMEESKEDIIEGYKEVVAAYPESEGTKLLKDPWAGLMIAHLKMIRAGLSDHNANKKGDNLRTSTFASESYGEPSPPLD